MVRTRKGASEVTRRKMCYFFDFGEWNIVHTLTKIILLFNKVRFVENIVYFLILIKWKKTLVYLPSSDELPINLIKSSHTPSQHELLLFAPDYCQPPWLDIRADVIVWYCKHNYIDLYAISYSIIMAYRNQKCQTFDSVT